MKKKPPYISSKITKTNVVLRDRALARHVPRTRLFSGSVLRAMLDRYSLVYAKPVHGSLGIGVMRVEKRGKHYRYQSGVNKFTFPTFKSMLKSLRERIRSKPYIIQKGIHLLRHKGRPFDFRVVVQKNFQGRWEATGTAARIAHPRKAVTNGSQGGAISPAPALLKRYVGKRQTPLMIKAMNNMARRAAIQFGRAYPAMHELGLDIAIDRSLYPWILEANTRPDPCPFTKLPDKSMIRKIVAYGKANGRRYSLRCTKARSAYGGSR